jgi:hypothetical protein
MVLLTPLSVSCLMLDTAARGDVSVPWLLADSAVRLQKARSREVRCVQAERCSRSM